MVDKKDNKPVPTNNAPINEVNQYGDRSVHANHIDHLTLNVFNSQTSSPTDENGISFVPITPTRYDHKTKTIFLGNETITLPIELTPISNIDSYKLPYIDALCEVYAEKISKAVTTDTIDNLPTGLRHNFAEQRKAFYSAESVQHSVREVFADGEQQFDALKKDAFDGISNIYYDDRHQSGYARLLAVLDKITNTTLNKSSLMNIVGLIGNLEKKGVCHILVNDDIIKSWVNIDE